MTVDGELEDVDGEIEVVELGTLYCSAGCKECVRVERAEGWCEDDGGGGGGGSVRSLSSSVVLSSSLMRNAGPSNNR